MNKLIVVEDDRIIRKSLTMAPWERIGVSFVGEASNGEEGLQLIEKEKPDVIISDINMPFLNGLEMARRTKEISPISRIIFLTGYDEFQYAKEALQLKAFDYILKPVNIDDLFEKVQGALADIDQERKNEQQLAQTRPLLQESFFQKLMKYGKEKIDIEEELANLDIFLQGPFYVAYLIHMESNDAIEARINKETIQNIISCKLVDYDYSILSAGLDRVALLVSLDATDQHEKTKLGEKLLDGIKKVIDKEVTIAYGRTYSNVFGVGVSLIEAQIALETNLLFQKSGVYSINENFMNNNEMDDVFAYYDHVLENLIRLEVPQRLIETLQKLRMSLINKRIPLQEVKLFCLKYVSLLDYEIKKLDRDTISKMNIFDLSKKINQSGSTTEVVDVLIALSEEWSDLIAGKRTKGNKSIVEEAMEFMKNNFHNHSLTLQKVADELFVSAPYLSNLFKEEKGINFSEYLLELRMNAARKLLKESDEKTYVVAEKVGYKNPQYFSSSFKKYTGFSPMDYRNGI